MPCVDLRYVEVGEACCHIDREDNSRYTGHTAVADVVKDTNHAEDDCGTGLAAARLACSKGAPLKEKAERSSAASAKAVLAWAETVSA